MSVSHYLLSLEVTISPHSVIAPQSSSWGFSHQWIHEAGLTELTGTVFSLTESGMGSEKVSRPDYLCLKRLECCKSTNTDTSTAKKGTLFAKASAIRKKLDSNILKSEAGSIFKDWTGKGEAPRDV